MKKTFFIANWKEHKTTDEALRWLREFPISDFRFSKDNIEIILCPSFALLPIVKAEIERLHLPIKLGAQDFSAFDEGAYTGEESPKLVKEYVQYAIIGHSERRKHFAESDELIAQKVTCAMKHGVKPILCVQDVNTSIPEHVSFVAYEPVSAIGTGKPDIPENADAVSKELHKRLENGHVFYGGSVTGENVASFLNKESMSGVLVGTQSLHPSHFVQIILNAKI